MKNEPAAQRYPCGFRFPRISVTDYLCTGPPNSSLELTRGPFLGVRKETARRHAGCISLLPAAPSGAAAACRGRPAREARAQLSVGVRPIARETHAQGVFAPAPVASRWLRLVPCDALFSRDGERSAEADRSSP